MRNETECSATTSGPPYPSEAVPFDIDGALALNQHGGMKMKGRDPFRLEIDPPEVEESSSSPPTPHGKKNNSVVDPVKQESRAGATTPQPSSPSKKKNERKGIFRALSRVLKRGKGKGSSSPKKNTKRTNVTDPLDTEFDENDPFALLQRQKANSIRSESGGMMSSISSMGDVSELHRLNKGDRNKSKMDKLSMSFSSGDSARLSRRVEQERRRLGSQQIEVGPLGDEHARWDSPVMQNSPKRTKDFKSPSQMSSEGDVAAMQSFAPPFGVSPSRQSSNSSVVKNVNSIGGAGTMRQSSLSSVGSNNKSRATPARQSSNSSGSNSGRGAPMRQTSNSSVSSHNREPRSRQPMASSNGSNSHHERSLRLCQNGSESYGLSYGMRQQGDGHLSQSCSRPIGPCGDSLQPAGRDLDALLSPRINDEYNASRENSRRSVRTSDRDLDGAHNSSRESSRRSVRTSDRELDGGQYSTLDALLSPRSTNEYPVRDLPDRENMSISSQYSRRSAPARTSPGDYDYRNSYSHSPNDRDPGYYRRTRNENDDRIRDLKDELGGVRPNRAGRSGPTDIEIAPGVYKPLRGSDETLRAIEHGNITRTTCFSCTLELHCLDDAEYVLCPVCRVVGPVDSNANRDGYGHGVGLGVKPDQMRRWRSEIDRNRC